MNWKHFLIPVILSLAGAAALTRRGGTSVPDEKVPCAPKFFRGVLLPPVEEGPWSSPALEIFYPGEHNVRPALPGRFPRESPTVGRPNCVHGTPPGGDLRPAPYSLEEFQSGRLGRSLRSLL
jgi:hypothetical protein